MPVVDASVVFSYLTAAQAYESAHDALTDPDEFAWAPYLVDAEVGHVLRRAVLSKRLANDAALRALRALANLPLERAVHGPLLERAWALRANASFYDALYIALAEVLEMPLLTLDARLARLRSKSVEVRVLS